MEIKGAVKSAASEKEIRMRVSKRPSLGLLLLMTMMFSTRLTEALSYWSVGVFMGFIAFGGFAHFYMYSKVRYRRNDNMVDRLNKTVVEHYVFRNTDFIDEHHRACRPIYVSTRASLLPNRI